MADKDYAAVLREEVRDQTKAVLEYVGQLPGIMCDIVQLKEDVAE